MKKPSISDLKTIQIISKDLEEQLTKQTSAPELPIKSIPELNNILWGLQRKKMYIIGARTSNFKTQLSLNLCYDLALQGKKVLFLSLETHEVYLVRRLFCMATQTDSEKLTRTEYKHNLEYQERFKQFRKTIANMHMIISDCLGKDWSFIDKVLSGFKVPVDAVFIDHIQEIRGGQSKKDAIDEYISKIRESAIRNNFALVLCSQVNRLSQADKDDREPQLHHLKSSGFLEESADCCILLHHPYNYDNTKDENELVVNIAKNREGRTGRLKLKVYPQYCMIRDSKFVFQNDFRENIKNIIEPEPCNWED